MKKIVVIASLCMSCFITGCGDTTSKEIVELTETTVPTDTVEAVIEDETENIIKEDIVKENISFNGDVIFTENLILYLKSDGTVWGKGTNDNGELGNGKREDSDTWTQVEGIDNITGIYASSNYGDDYCDHLHCYALTTDGELYRWGGNIVTPEKVELFTKITEISRPFEGPDYYMTIACEDGSKYVMLDSFLDGEEDYFVPYDYENATNICISKSFMLIDGELYDYDLSEDISNLKSSSELVCDMYFEDIIQTNKVECDEPLSGGRWYYGNVKGESGVIDKVETYTFVGTNTGHVYYWIYEDDDDFKDIESAGGANIKYYGHSWDCETRFFLYNGGSISTTGENDYGQLGDGTYEAFDDDWEIDDAVFSELLCTTYYSDRVAAIDTDNNVWAWGKGFGNTPEIIISAEDIFDN